jgi:hypothetical protein
VIDSCSYPSLKNGVILRLCYPPAFLLHQSSSLHDFLNKSASSQHFFQSFPTYLTTPVPPTAFCCLNFLQLGTATQWTFSACSIKMISLFACFTSRMMTVSIKVFCLEIRVRKLSGEMLTKCIFFMI